MLARATRHEGPDGAPSAIAQIARSVAIFAAFSIETGVYGFLSAIAVYVVAEFSGMRGDRASGWFAVTFMLGVAAGAVRGLWHVFRYATGRY